MLFMPLVTSRPLLCPPPVGSGPEEDWKMRRAFARAETGGGTGSFVLFFDFCVSLCGAPATSMQRQRAG